MYTQLILDCKTRQKNLITDVILFCDKLTEEYNHIEFQYQQSNTLFEYEIIGREKYIIEIDKNNTVCVRIWDEQKESITFITPNTICHAICDGPIGYRNGIEIEMTRCEFLYYFHMNIHHHPTLYDYNPDLDEFEVIPTPVYRYLKFGIDMRNNSVIYIQENIDNNYEWKFFVNGKRIDLSSIFPNTLAFF